MFIEQTITKLQELRLAGLADAYREQATNTSISNLSFDERFAMLIDREWLGQTNRRMAARLKNARLRQDAALENLNWSASRGLNHEQLAQLSDSRWIQSGQRCIITGPTGVGKSYLACALGHRACRDGFKVLYCYVPKFFRELHAANVDGTLGRFYRRMSRIHLLILDDWAMVAANAVQYRDFLELLEERSDNSAMIITSQYPMTAWHDIIAEDTIADAICDRLRHNAYHIELKGESMRKTNK